VRPKPLSSNRIDRGRCKRRPAFAPRLVIMAKAPVAGRVKTRLIREIGVAEATRFARVALRTTLGRFGLQPFWQTILAVTPDAATASHVWPRGLHVIGQSAGDLGTRMQRPMRDFPPGPVCVIGSDIPDITVADIRRAFRLLGSRDVVFGPAKDGGFWLVGMQRLGRLPKPYRGVRWSQSDTLARVLENLNAEKIGFTSMHRDVDTASDLVGVAHLFGRRIRPSIADRQVACTRKAVH
jgi:rSAM/selenodomain-associated transferase 1